MTDEKTRVLIQVMLSIAAQFIAAFEDYLSTPYDRSILAKRREKVR